MGSFLDLLTPDGVSGFAALSIVVTAFATSALTAAVGIGGGLALLAAMGLAFPPAAVVPVHGVAQLGSNFGRFVLLRPHAVWWIIGWFAVGAIAGSLIGARLYVALPENVLRLGVAAFILFTVWGPKPKSYAAGKGAFALGGAVSSFLTMFFGATGPIVASILSAAKLDRLQTVSTHATCLVLQHGLKSLAFGALGFAFAEWAALISAILVSGFAGTYLGTRLLHKIPEAQFRKVFKWALTMIASYMFIISVRSMSLS